MRSTSPRSRAQVVSTVRSEYSKGSVCLRTRVWSQTAPLQRLKGRMQNPHAAQQHHKGKQHAVIFLTSGAKEFAAIESASCGGTGPWRWAGLRSVGAAGVG